jgi:putative two-component system response regulator
VSEEKLSTARILIVDDDEMFRLAHSSLVETFGYAYELAGDGFEALAKLVMEIDLVLLDADMPHMDGFEVARRIRADPALELLPIVMVSGLTSREDRIRALEVGINDFVHKPVDPHELQLRLKWLLELKKAYDALAEHRAELESTVEQRTAALRGALEDVSKARRNTHEARRNTHEAHLDTIRRLTVAAEFRDEDTASHIERIGLYSEVMARALNMPPTDVETIRHAAPMHDVGKIGVPDGILPPRPGAHSRPATAAADSPAVDSVSQTPIT